MRHGLTKRTDSDFQPDRAARVIFTGMLRFRNRVSSLESRVSSSNQTHTDCRYKQETFRSLKTSSNISKSISKLTGSQSGAARTAAPFLVQSRSCCPMFCFYQTKMLLQFISDSLSKIWVFIFYFLTPSVHVRFLRVRQNHSEVYNIL